MGFLSTLLKQYLIKRHLGMSTCTPFYFSSLSSISAKHAKQKQQNRKSLIENNLPKKSNEPPQLFFLQ